MKPAFLIIFTVFLFQLSAQVNPALNELVIPIIARVQENPPRITLHWNHSTAEGTRYNLYRKRQADLTWNFIDFAPVSDSFYIDRNVETGVV
jgi:hypothetical protein